MFQHALEQYPGWTPSLSRWATYDRLLALVATPFESFWGPHSLVGGINQAKTVDVFQLQRQNGTLALVRFRSADRPIYPAPYRWVEKWATYETGTGTRAGVGVLMAISATILGLETIFLVRYRHRPQLKAASWAFLLLMLGTATATTLAIPVYLVSAPTTVWCALQMMLAVVSLTVILSTLIVTTWRIKRIFTRRELKVESLPNRLLLEMVGGALALMVLLVGSALALQPAEIIPNEERNDATQHYLRYKTCSFGWGPLLAALIPAGLITLYGVYLAWRIRDVPNEFNNSQHVASALLFTSGYIIVATVILFLVGRSPQVLAIYCSLSLVLCVHLPVQLSVFPKLVAGNQVTTYQPTRIASDKRVSPAAWAPGSSTNGSVVTSALHPLPRSSAS